MQLSVRIAAANALHGAQIGPVHANQQIKPVIICARHLPRRMLPARDSLLKQLAPRRRIHRIADLLTADSRRFDLPVTRDAFSLYQFLHDIFCHRTAAYIPMADKKYPHSNASCCFSPSYHTEPQSSRNFKTPVLHHSCERHARLVFSCKTVPRRTEFYSLSIRRGISIMRSCSLYCGSCDPAIHQPVSKKLLLDGAVRSFRVVCCIYTIADFRSAGTSFSRNAVLRE